MIMMMIDTMTGSTRDQSICMTTITLENFQNGE
jgi:hypothetical protein